MAEPYVLRSEQCIPRPIEEVFSFFIDAENLERITPPWLNFKIISSRPIAMAAGARIVYRLAWRGIPMRWVTEIAEWQPPHRFIDVQLQGPYKLWRHSHTFEPDGAGARMKDEVQYQLPFGAIGRIVHALSVKRNVHAIFAYRTQAIERIFAGKA